MKILLRAIALAAVALGAQPDGRAAAGSKVEPAWSAACSHYENRARFASRVERVEFPAVLAEGCIAAQRSLDAARPGRERDEAARLFLIRLVSARAQIDAINMGRIEAALAERADERSFTRATRDLRRALRLVNPAGEYLILRSEGVFDALGAWVEAGADFELLAALPMK